MKNNLRLVAFVMCISTVAHAQITITTSDVVGVGAVVPLFEDLNPGLAITPGNSGSGQSWDFSTLKNESSDTLFFLDHTTLPKYMDFPTATIGYKSTEDADSAWAFMRNTPEELRILGGAGIEDNGDTVSAEFQILITALPASLGTSYSDDIFQFSQGDTINLDPDGPLPHPFVDSIRFTSWVQYSAEYDAEGTLITPSGTFNAIRQNTLEVQNDTIFMFANGMWSVASSTLATLIFMDPISNDTSFGYTWWSNETIGFPIVEMEVDENDDVEDVSWAPLTPVGIPAAKSPDYNIYPNPAADQINIDLGTAPSGSNEFIIYDMSGKILIQSSLYQRISSIAVDWLAPGIYVYEVRSQRNPIDRGKITVQ